MGRRPGARQSRNIILVVCEDGESSPAYFEALRSSLRLSTSKIEVCGKECGSAPISVVDFAIQRRNERRDAGHFVDIVFCVVDVDTHSSLHRALDKANSNDLQVVVSSPCFELWYLLHFDPGGKHYLDCDRLVRALRKYIPDYDKGSFREFDFLWEKTRSAITHAKKLVELRGDERLRNPSTEVHLVVETFLAEAQSGPTETGLPGALVTGNAGTRKSRTRTASDR